MFKKLRQVFQNQTQRRFKLIQIEPSLDCSLDCVMCPWSELRPVGAVMEWETFTQVSPFLSQAESVDLTGGGEPLKNPRLVDMVRAAKEAGCRVGFSTNGMLLLQEVSEQLMDAGLDWISFSVDAASPELYERIRHGGKFQTVIDHISALRDLKESRRSQSPKMMMVFVMMIGEQQNFHELPAFITLASSLGVEQVIAKNLDVIIKEGDDQRRFFSHQGDPAPEILQAMEQARQRADELGIGLRYYGLRPQEVTICEHNPLRNTFINWEGHVSPCITLSYAEQRFFDGQRIHVPCQRFGNIRSTHLSEIWELPEYRLFRRQFDSRVQLEQQAAVDHFLDGAAYTDQVLPPAPEGCRTCYYLFGI